MMEAQPSSALMFDFDEGLISLNRFRSVQAWKNEKGAVHTSIATIGTLYNEMLILRRNVAFSRSERA